MSHMYMYIQSQLAHHAVPVDVIVVAADAFLLI